MRLQLVWKLIVVVASFSCMSSSSFSVVAQAADSNKGYPNKVDPNKEVDANSKSDPGVQSGALPSTKLTTAVTSEDLPIKYWGNSFSLKFHRPSCPFAKAMSAHHVMFFNFRKQAVESGQAPCRYCLPPNWTTVRASIWHPAELPAKTQTP